jgi:threonine synthase
MTGPTADTTGSATRSGHLAYQQCIHPHCSATFPVDETHFSCPRCGDLLDVVYDWGRLPVPGTLAEFGSRWADRPNPLNFSGVWRFRDLLPFAPESMIVTIGEGQTLLQRADKVGRHVGMAPGCLMLQYEGMNPSGSFKDNGMAAAFTHARIVGAHRVACASTGNTSAALAVYCSATPFGFRAIIFIGSGKIAYGKLAQALDHGAVTLQIEGDFDDAMQRVRQVADRLGIYLMNSVNPFRLEGQKTIMYRVLEGLGWEVPDWIVVPGGNLGNSSAFGKAFIELKHLGLIDRVPRLAVINAAGARTLDELHGSRRVLWRQGLPDMDAVSGYYEDLDSSGRKASTIASAIEINRPVNLKKCLRALDFCDGVVRQVSDQEIMDAKASVGAGGLGCEPASAASVAGARRLREEGIIAPSDRVVCILTGHQLKDPTATVAYHAADPEQFARVLGSRGVTRAEYANRPVLVPNDLDTIIEAISRLTQGDLARTSSVSPAPDAENAARVDPAS